MVAVVAVLLMVTGKQVVVVVVEISQLFQDLVLMMEEVLIIKRVVMEVVGVEAVVLLVRFLGRSLDWVVKEP